MGETNEMRTVSGDSAESLARGRPLAEIGLRTFAPELPANLIALPLEGEREPDLLVSAGRVWRRARPTQFGKVEHAIDGLPVLAVAELGEFDRRAAVMAERQEQRAKERRQWLEANRREPTLEDVSTVPNLPTIAGAYREIVEDCFGQISLDRKSGRLHVRVAPESAGMSQGYRWRRAMLVIAAAQDFVAAELAAGRELPDLPCSALGRPISD